MCYSCIEKALRDVVPAVVADLSNSEASQETTRLFELAVGTVSSSSKWDATENPMPAAARILVGQMLERCTIAPGLFVAPPPARMARFLHNVCIRMNTVKVANPRNIQMPGIDTISQCIKELLLQLRQAEMLQETPDVPPEDIIAAAAKGDLGIVRQLVAAKRNGGNDEGGVTDPKTTPRGTSSYIDFRFLRSRGQDFNDMVVEPLTAAAMGGHADVVSYLLKLDQRGLVVADAGGMGERIFAAAAASGSLTVLKLLHTSGFTKDAGVHEEPAIVQAARAGHAEVVSLLLDLGASSVNQRRSEQSYSRTYGSRTARPTALWAASDEGRQDVVRLLVARKAKLDECTNGQTPLGRAIAMDHLGTVDILQAAGAPEGFIGGSAMAIKNAGQLDLGKFAALNSKLARPSPIVQDSRQKGSLTQ